MSNKRGEKKSSAYPKVVIATIVLAVLAAGCFVANRYMTQNKAQRLAAMQAEARATNEALDRQYQADLAAFRAENTGGANISWPTPKAEGWDIVDLTSYPLESPTTVTLDRQDLLYNGMLLVNQWHSRPTDFDESKVVRVKSYSGNVIRAKDNSIALLPAAADAWKTMLEAAQVQKGYDYYMLEEGFRSFQTQEGLFNKEKQRLQSRYDDEAELNAAVAQRVNLPGTSEYNTGLSAHPRVYLKENAEINAKDSNFFESEEGLWLLDHAAEYGFIFRFPLADYPVKGTQDKSYKTGVSSRLRLFRYVGVPNATVMTAMNFCLEEYLDYLAEHPHIAVFQDGQLRYEIIREPVDDTGDTVTVTESDKPGVSAIEVMLDNMGYAITILEF